MIELLQLFNRRATDIDDLLMNTLGAFASMKIGNPAKPTPQVCDTVSKLTAIKSLTV
jgi:VanZ family protein